MSTNKMATGHENDVEEVQFTEVTESNKLDDSERMKLATVMKENKCLWGSEKYSKEEKQAALVNLEEVFNLKYTSTDLLSVWKSLRASMLREVKKQRKEPGVKSVWKFYQAMLFLKPTLDKACDKAEEWTDEEKRSLINFYNRNHELWNHKLKDYHDKRRREVLLTKLKEELNNKFQEKEIVNTWNNMKTYYDRERLREKGSKSSGAGTSQVYHSSWKFFQEMSFVADGNTEPDHPRTTLDFCTVSMSPSTSEDGTPDAQSQQPAGRSKRRSSATKDDETKAKRNLMYEAAIQFMQQPAPPPPPPQPKGDDDRFGEYIAGQLKLITDPRSKVVIKAKINNLFLTQQMEQIPAAAPSLQLNTPQFFSSQDYGQYY